LEGPVYLRGSDNPLPDLVADLDGLVEIDLVGRIDQANQRIRTTFEVIPDVPVGTFTLQMNGGSGGLLVNSRKMCADNATRVAIRGQNGARWVRDVPLQAEACGYEQARKLERKAAKLRAQAKKLRSKARRASGKRAAKLRAKARAKAKQA